VKSRSPTDGSSLEAPVPTRRSIHALLKRFHERLKSKDARERTRGVIAFPFLKPKEAPPELVTALKDASADARSWSVLVLGRIDDPKTPPP
jgi:hypothetical protein